MSRDVVIYSLLCKVCLHSTCDSTNPAYRSSVVTLRCGMETMNPFDLSILAEFCVYFFLQFYKHGGSKANAYGT
jgi:hypothetical protein